LPSSETKEQDEKLRLKLQFVRVVVGYLAIDITVSFIFVLRFFSVSNHSRSQGGKEGHLSPHMENQINNSRNAI